MNRAVRRRFGHTMRDEVTDMAMPYALLRAGFPYVKTLGMRRVTDAPVGVAVGSDDKVYVLCRLPRLLAHQEAHLGR